MSADLTCPHCLTGWATQEHIGPSHITPVPGDVMLCADCGQPAIYHTGPGGALILRGPTQAELAKLGEHPVVIAASQTIAHHPHSPVESIAAARRAVRR